MSHTHSRIAALVLAALSLAALSAAQTGGQPATPPTPEAAHHHVMPNPVNLQVLPKDIKPVDLIALMRQYQGQLGVECGYCHAEDPATHRLNFASDANPQKATARLMIAMTRDINEKYVSKVPGGDRQVNCGTCHRGMAVPSNFIPADEEHPPAPPKP